jgi:DNA-directed RNA polymerase subunit H (RpoH/RPB5)
MNSASGKTIVVAVYLDGSKHLKATKNFLASVAGLKAGPAREVLVVLGPVSGMSESSVNKYIDKANALLRPALGRAVKHLIFQTNLPEHVLVPLHEPLSEAEAEQLEKDFCLDRKKIASLILWQTDPACIWCGAVPGQVVRITHSSEVAGECIDYRMCV